MSPHYEVDGRGLATSECLIVALFCYCTTLFCLSVLIIDNGLYTCYVITSYVSFPR